MMDFNFGARGFINNQLLVHDLQRVGNRASLGSAIARRPSPSSAASSAFSVSRPSAVIRFVGSLTT